MSVLGCFALIQRLVMFYNFLVVKKYQILQFLFFIGSRMMMVKKKGHDFRPGMTYARAQSAVLTRATDLRSVSYTTCVICGQWACAERNLPIRKQNCTSFEE